MNEQSLSIRQKTEAVIFACGEPIERTRLTEALGCTPEALDEALQEIKKDYDSRNSAVELLLLDSKVQFATRPQYAGFIREVLDIKRNQPLSSAAFEVLAVIAYNQPVTRAFVEQVRGVDCGGVINTLCQRYLIEECGRLDLPGRPLIYCTTTEFLKCFCMSSLAELPDIPDPKAAAKALEDIHTPSSVLEGQITIL